MCSSSSVCGVSPEAASSGASIGFPQLPMFLGIKVNGMTPQKQETGKLEEVLIKSLSRVDAKLRFERDQRGLLPHQSRL